MKSTELRLMGASLAVLVPDRKQGLSLATIQRDPNPDIPFPGYWELPGGGVEQHDYTRAGKLGPEVRCARREAFEEVRILVSEADVIWHARYPSIADRTAYNAFVVANGTPDALGSMQLGNEGRRCAFMPVEEFLQRDDVLAPHQQRLTDFLRGTSERALAFEALTSLLPA